MSDHDPFGWDDSSAHDAGPHDPGPHDPGAGHDDAAGWPQHDPPGYEDGAGPVGDPSWAEAFDAGPAADLSDLSELGDLSATDTPGQEYGGEFGVPELVGEAAAGQPGGLLDSWPVGADPDHVAGQHVPADLFPPALDVPLPEPVDGHPWADPALLGDAPIGAAVDAAVGGAWMADPAGLAAYAGVEPAPDADPWAVLADSDDPATSALARWWAPDPPAAG